MTSHSPKLTRRSGTPTSTTTSLSALSTTAIKDGHRGHLPPHNLPQHTPLTLEAERAERISRLAGLERVSMRTPNSQNPSPSHPQSGSPAYFDAQGQPAALTKMSTVGTASATESYSGDDDGRTTTVDEDGLSLGTREVGSVVSHGDTSHGDASHVGELASHEGDDRGDDRSDDASLVGFGEGAGSTISGPIYRRHGVERTSSGLSERGSETPVSNAAVQERRAARMTNGVAVDDGGEGFVDTTTREPVVVSPRREQRKA